MAQLAGQVAQYQDVGFRIWGDRSQTAMQVNQVHERAPDQENQICHKGRH